MSDMMEQRREALTRRLDQMQQMDEWHRFQNFVLGLLPHDGYTGVRHSVVRNDFGRDGLAVTPQGENCFVAVSFDGSLSKIRKDADRWSQDENREPATVMLFMTWDAPTEVKTAEWRGKIKREFALDLRIIHKETILATGTREGVWRETCSRLGIPGYRAGYLRVNPYNGEVVRHGLQARPPEWLGRRVPLSEWKDLTDTIRPRVILGKPGSGKTMTLFVQLERAEPHNLLIVEKDLRETTQLDGLLDDAAGGGVIVFDDAHEKPEEFKRLCEALLARKRDAPRIAERYKNVVILAAARSQEWAALQRDLPMAQLQDLDLLGKAEITLANLDQDQCAEFIRICRDDWNLNIDDRLLSQAAQEAARRDATPLYVISMLAPIRVVEDRTLRDEHLAGLPKDVLGLWQRYWDRLTPVQQGVLKLVKLFMGTKVEAQPHLLSAAARQFEIPPHERTAALDWLEDAIWITRPSGTPKCLDVQLEAIPLDEPTYAAWDEFVHGSSEGRQTALQLHNGTGVYYCEVRAPRSPSHQELRAALLSAARHFEALGSLRVGAADRPLTAASLNNASVCYSHLASLETTLEARRERLDQAVDAVEEAIRMRRDLGLRADLAASLNNASNCYSDLANLETTREARRARLDQAIKAVEESVGIRRDLGLRADLARSLANASSCYSEPAKLETTREAQRERLDHAVAAVEESIRIRRDLGLRADLAASLNNASNCYSELADLETTPEARRERLDQAVEAVEEAVRIRRDMGLRADLAASLNNASNRYSELADLETPPEARRARLDKAVEAVEEAVCIYRDLGLQGELGTSLATSALRYRHLAASVEGATDRPSLLAKSLARIEEALALFQAAGYVQFTIQATQDTVIAHRILAEATGQLDREKVLALCDEGLRLAEPMGDEQRAEFFRQTKRAL